MNQEYPECTFNLPIEQRFCDFCSVWCPFGHPFQGSFTTSGDTEAIDPEIYTTPNSEAI